MSLYSPWSILGIEPTEDRRAIRVAYARRLKEIDVDADPQAFIALREALESAQQQAEWAELDRQWAEQQETDDDARDEDAVDPDDIAAELDRQKLTTAYYALPPASDRLTVPADARWEQAEAPSSETTEEARAAPEDDRWAPTEPPAPPERAEPYPHPADDRWETPEPAPAPELPELPPRSSPWAPFAPVDVDAHVQALLRLLHELDALHDTDGAPPQGWEAQMLEHWRVIAGDPRMQEIGHFADAERWWSDVIARSIPWSDPLVRPAVELFGWLAQAGEFHQLPAAAHVVQRLHSMDFFRAVQARKHPLNPAWRELVRPARAGSWRGWANSVRVRELLATVRTHYPDLEACFDANRVGIWEGRVTSPGGGYNWSGGFPIWGWIVIVVFGALMLIGQLDKKPGGPGIATVPPISVQAPSTTALDNQDKDIALALILAAGPELRWSDVQRTNVPLAATLKSNWQIAREDKEARIAFTMRMRKLLLDRYRAALAHADYPTIAEYRRILLDQARHLQRRSIADCDKFFRGESVASKDLPATLRSRDRALIARVLLASNGPEPVKGNGKFSIESAVGEKAARKAGLGYEQFIAALNGRGTAAQRCTGRIALIETALDLPPAEGLQLLRDM